MNDLPRAREPGTADRHPMRLAALTAVIAGVVLLAAAAFVFSYPGIHEIALTAGVRPALAGLYPVLFDATAVVAFAAALALRGAGWWTRCYVWAATLVLLAAVAAGDAVHAMGVALPRKPAAAAVAVIPWVLLLLAFGFLLAMLRQLRRSRIAASAGRRGGQPNGSGPGERRPTRLTLDTLLDPRPASTAPKLDDRPPASPANVKITAAARPAALPSVPAGPRPPAAPALSAPKTAAPAEGPSADCGEPGRAAAPQPLTAPPLSAPLPHLQRPRSSPTPPEDQEHPQP